MLPRIGQFAARYVANFEGHYAGSAVLIVVEQCGEVVLYRTWDGRNVAKVGDGSYQIDDVIPPVPISSDDPHRI